jgi:hypothetical protein
MDHETIFAVVTLCFGFALMPILYFLPRPAGWVGKLMPYAIMAVAAVLEFKMILPLFR